MRRACNLPAGGTPNGMTKTQELPASRTGRHLIPLETNNYNRLKRFLFILAIVFGSVSVTNAQELGIRMGAVTGGSGGAAIDGVFALGQFNRIHADLAFGSGGFGIDFIWDFMYHPLGNEAFNWYLGAGPYLIFGYDFNFGAIAEIGLEYRFINAPIALGFDWRPYFEIVDDTHLSAKGFGLNVRYVFGQ